MKNKSNRILVVDDDQLLREFYDRVFENMGYSSVCVSDGQEAIDFLENAESPFALVIMDLLMPVKTGWEAIEYIRRNEQWRGLPILAITGMACSEEELGMIREKCDDVILKPEFEMHHFHEAVDRLIKHGPTHTRRNG